VPVCLFILPLFFCLCVCVASSFLQVWSP